MKNFENTRRERESSGPINWEAKIDHLADVLNREGYLKDYDKSASIKKKIKTLKEVLETERKNIELIKKQHPGIHPLGIKYMDDMITQGEKELKEIEENYKKY